MHRRNTLYKSFQIIAVVSLLMLLACAFIFWILNERHLNNRSAHQEIPAAALSTPSPTPLGVAYNPKKVASSIAGYPPSWKLGVGPPLRNHPECSGEVEEDELYDGHGSSVYITICAVNQANLEALLEVEAPDTERSSLRYMPGIAVPSTRFGLSGLKGAWRQGVEGRYEPAYFEIYLKNQRMILISTGEPSYDQRLATLLPYVTLIF